VRYAEVIKPACAIATAGRPDFCILAFITGETTRTITVEKSGDYSVSITNFRCENEAKTTTLNFVNCDPHLTMPNVFTPDGDDKNPVF
jgi:hypothetical protein